MKFALIDGLHIQYGDLKVESQVNWNASFHVTCDGKACGVTCSACDGGREEKRSDAAGCGERQDIRAEKDETGSLARVSSTAHRTGMMHLKTMYITDSSASLS